MADDDDGKCEVEKWVDSVAGVVKDFVSPPDTPSKESWEAQCEAHDKEND